MPHATLPCPSLSPGVCSSSCPLGWWCHPTISSSVAPFSSCPQSFPASRSFPMSWLFTSGGQNIGASASASVLWHVCTHETVTIIKIMNISIIPRSFLVPLGNLFLPPFLIPAPASLGTPWSAFCHCILAFPTILCKWIHIVRNLFLVWLLSCNLIILIHPCCGSQQTVENSSRDGNTSPP